MQHSIKSMHSFRSSELWYGKWSNFLLLLLLFFVVVVVAKFKMTPKFIRTILSCAIAPPPHPLPSPHPHTSTLHLPSGKFLSFPCRSQQGKRFTLITDNYFRHRSCLWHAVIAATPRSLSGCTSIKHAGYQINLIALCHKSATSKASSGYFCCCMLVIFFSLALTGHHLLIYVVIIITHSVVHATIYM